MGMAYYMSFFQRHVQDPLGNVFSDRCTVLQRHEGFLMSWLSIEHCSKNCRAIRQNILDFYARVLAFSQVTVQESNAALLDLR